MRKLRSAPLLPQISYGMIGAAFLGVAVFAAIQTLRLQVEEQEEDQLQARSETEGLVRLWSGSVTQRATQWALDLAAADDIARAERQMRLAHPDFESVFVWQVDAVGKLVVHPTSPARPTPSSACLDLASRDAATQSLSQAAATWARCRGDGALTDLYAVNQAARLLLASDEPGPAWDMLMSVRTQLYAPLTELRAEVPGPELLLARRMLAAEALGATGDRRRQAQLLSRTCTELSDLPAPLLATGLAPLEALAPLAVELGDPTAAPELRERLARMRRRLAGWEAATPWAAASRPDPLERADRRRAEAIPVDGPQLALFGLTLSQEPPLAVAVQLSGPALVDDLLGLARTTMPGRDPVVLSADGTPLAGEPCAEGTTTVEATLAPTLRGARLVLCRPLGDASTRGPLAGLTTRLAPMLAALVLGAFALAGRVSADRRQRELYERQRAFVARVTHELKTPLAGIRVMAETLELGAVPAERLPAWATRIMDEADRLSARIDEVLKLARRDERTRPEPVLAHALAAQVAGPWGPRFENVGGRLELDLQTCPEVLADRALLEDALGNLIDNALKYRREDRPPLVRLATRPEGRWVVFEVSDNGLGVPPAQRKLIFEPFARVEGPGRGKAGGHGLGLSFVAETARVHGGSVECREAPGGGARFLLRLRRQRWRSVGWPASSSSKTTTPSDSGS